MLKINISRIYTYNYIGILSKNQMIKPNDMPKSLRANIFNQFPIGYEIHNLEDKPLTDIVYPEYKKSLNGNWIAIEHKIDLQPNEFIILPTRYLLFYLFKYNFINKNNNIINNNLEVNNGKFKSIIKLNECKNIEALLNNFYFEPNNILQSCKITYDRTYNYTIMEFFYRKMGYVELTPNLSFTKTKHIFIIEPEMLKIFGNYHNYISPNTNKNNKINLKSIDSLLFMNYLRNE